MAGPADRVCFKRAKWFTNQSINAYPETPSPWALQKSPAELRGFVTCRESHGVFSVFHLFVCLFSYIGDTGNKRNEILRVCGTG